jgi:uncharacterized protein (DUF433 family)
MRLAGVSKRRLEYWIGHRLVKPDISKARGRGTVRLFSFENLLELRVAVWLRSNDVSLQLIRKIVGKLKKRGLSHPLSAVGFAVVHRASARNKRAGPAGAHDVVLQLEDGSWETGALTGQKVMEMALPLRKFREELTRAVGKDRKRKKSIGKIERRRGVLGSAPVIAGTRVPTRAIWSLHRAGYTNKQILKNYPGLAIADIKAAIGLEGERRRASA